MEVRCEVVTEAPTEAIVALYRAAGWWRDGRDEPEQIAALVRGSFRFVVAREGDGRVVGMGRAIADGVSDAYIQDVVVLPERRGHGVGAQIIRRLVDECECSGVLWIALIAEPGTTAFYTRLGFQALEGYVPMRRGASSSS
jgi:GNAT superfamily N-acetyltransferase